jgi:hypothetical protein
LAIVTFNYDRSFEYYFTKLIGRRSGLSAADAYAIFNEIPLIHLHGSFGPPDSSIAGGLDYGAALTADNIRIAAENILVVSEVTDTLPTFEAAEQLFWRAERIRFLGFGYSPDNVRRLRIFGRDWTSAARRPHVSGIVHGFSAREWAAVEPLLNGLWNGGHSTGPMDFFRNFCPLD